MSDVHRNMMVAVATIAEAIDDKKRNCLVGSQIDLTISKQGMRRRYAKQC